MSICCWISISAQKKMQLVPTFENCSYYCDSVFDVAFDKAWNTSATFRLLYKAKDELQWKEVFAPYYDTQRFQLRGSIMNLEENTEYEIAGILAGNQPLCIVPSEEGTLFDGVAAKKAEKTVSSR